MAKIFIVEDEWLVTLELKQRIEDLGYEVAGSEDNGEMAIKMVMETKPDLILMDINIKGDIDGIETSRRILLKYNVPIVYLTAYSDKATLERAKVTSPYGYIIKPVDERDLLVSIEISLSKFEMEKKIRVSEKNLSITLQSIGDGVIATDEKSLITRMNRTAEKMCGWTFEEAKGLPLKDVFSIISAITRKSVDNPIEEVLRTGEIVELSNHTILISRDGTERHISDSAAPIRDDSDEILGIVLVFSDVTEAYKNRQLLQESEKLYREVIENASDLIYTTDRSGRFIHANAAALRLTGYDKEYLSTKTFLDLLIPEYREKIKRHFFRQFLEKKTSTYTEIPVIKKDGSVVWFGQNVTLVLEADKVTGFHIISRDITDRKKAEDALREKETVLRLIIDIIPDRIFVKDLEGRFILNNIAHLQALGAKTQEEAVGKLDADYCPEEYSSIYRAQDKEVINTQMPLINFYHHEVGKNGEDLWLLISKLPFRTSGGKVIGIVGISKDISAQKQAEDAIRESKRRFQTLANNSPVGIFRTDATGYTTYVNPRWCEISGLSAEEAIGDGWLVAVHEEDKQQLNDEWYSAAKAKRPSRADYRFIKSDGTVAWVMGNAVPELDEANQIVGYVGTITDITDRKMIEEALRESENIFNQFMEHSPIYLFFKDEDDRPLRLSKNYEQLLSMPIQKMIGKTMFELFPSDLAKKMVEDDLKVMREGKLVEVEEELNGRFYTTIKFPILMEGKPCYLAGYTIDITDRKKHELEIKMLANALKSINEIVTITDMKNNLIFINQSFLNTYGYKEEELIGQNIAILGSPNNPPELLKEIFEETLNHGWQGEMLDIKKDGTEFPISLSTTLILDEKNNPMAMIGVAVDITLRKHSEAEIIKLNQAVIQSPASIVITDLKGNIEYVNHKAIETTGYIKKELLGKNPRIFSSGELSKEEYQILWKTVSSGKEWRGEFHNKKKGGELYWEYASISPIKNTSGQITHYLAIKENITDRKKLEQGLIEAKEKAEAANELKDAFIANISHEIRTPLNGVLGMTAIIKEVFAQHITSQEERYFAAIGRSSKRIIRTVDMILNFSRLQVGDLQTTSRKIKLGDTLNELYLEFTLSAKQKGLELLFENKIGELQIQSDTYCLNQVVSNLLDNAIKFTEMGTIKIILYTNEHQKICIDVEDTGIGISEEYLVQLFKPYTQEDVGYTRAYEGVGLGLSLVKKFLSLINAEISVKSKKGVGTTFTILFNETIHIPSNIKSEKVKEAFQTNNFNSHENKRGRAAILIVEDEEINQMFLSVKLQPLYDIAVAEDATTALEALEKRHFDVILMDISLKGGLSGIELTKILKDSDEYKHISIIAVTGHAFSQDRESCLAAGCDDYISKPFNVESLQNKIIKCIRST